MTNWTDDDRARFDKAKRIIKSGDTEALIEYISGLPRETIERLGGFGNCVTHHCCDCTAERIKQLERALAVSREHCIEQGRRIETLQDERDRLTRALERIADTNRDPRPDGTYNISREALIQTAARALNEANNLSTNVDKVKDSSHATEETE